MLTYLYLYYVTEPFYLVESEAPWDSSNPELPQHQSLYFSSTFSNVIKKILDIFSLLLIQEEQLSVTGERMYTKY